MSLYPDNWPRCQCGEPVLDGHLTCGQATCSESEARERERRRHVSAQFGFEVEERE